MDPEKKVAVGDNSESSLTESWNVVEVQEVNVSEGSDGESIEVIDEDSQNVDSNTSSNKEAGSDSECANETLRGDEEERTLIENCEVIQADVKNADSSETVTSAAHNLFYTSGFVIILIAVLSAGASFSVFLLQMENLALSTYNYFSSSAAIQNNDKEYQELLNQIKTYKEESKDLKNLITDLNSAVLSLKKELASQKHVVNNEIDKNQLHFPQETRKEDTLFQQILNVHTGNSLQGNTSDQGKEMPYEHSFRAIKEVVSAINDEYKRKEEIEIIKIFSQIPKHLAVLTNFDESNQNINKFIEVWEAKLIRVNEKLISDVKQMQLKMTRHIMKNLRDTQKNFFEKLCELKDMKSPQCYDTFIKPYQSFDYSTSPRAAGKNDPPGKGNSCYDTQNNKYTSDDNKVKSNFDKNNPPDKKKKQKIETIENNLTEGRVNDGENIISQNNDKVPVKPLSIENLNKKNVESDSVPGNSHDSSSFVKNPNSKHKNKYKPQVYSGKDKDKNARLEKVKQKMDKVKGAKEKKKKVQKVKGTKSSWNGEERGPGF